MKFDKMSLDQKDGIGTLTLENPEKLNAMSTEMWNDFRKIIDHIQGNQEIKVLVITGSGRGFCSGSDVGARLAANIEGRGPAKTQADLLEGTGYVAGLIRNLEIPIISRHKRGSRRGGAFPGPVKRYPHRLGNRPFWGHLGPGRSGR